MLEPITKTIEVPCSQEKAFTVFIERVDSWWPKAKNSVSAMAGEVAKMITIEPRLNGRVIEVGHDDVEHHWGSVTRYDPFKQLTIDWHINASPDEASQVDVAFIDVEAEKTKVVLTHSNWEVFGDRAADMRAGYDSGWVNVFEAAYRSACS